MFPVLQRLWDIVSEGVVSCEFGYWIFVRQRLLYDRRVPRYNNSSGISTRTKSLPPHLQYTRT